MGQMIVKQVSWVGTGAARKLQLDDAYDLAIIKGVSQYATILHPWQWLGGLQKFGNVSLSGTSDAGGWLDDDSLLLTSHGSVNAVATTYHALLLKDNGSDRLRTGSWMGYRSQTFASTGATSEAVTMDLLSGWAPDIMRLTRDANGATHEGVWLGYGWTKKESAAAVNNALATLNSDGTVSLSTDVSVNENDAQTLGEGTDFFAVKCDGVACEIVTYTGTGAGGNISTVRADTPVAVIVIPQAATAMTFWFSSMGANAADGGNTALAANKITGAGSGYFTLGTDASVNTNGTGYKALVFYDTSTAKSFLPWVNKTPRKALRFPVTGNGYVDCGVSDTLSVTGAITLEWIGAIGSQTSGEQVLMGRQGNGSTGSRSSPTAGSFNYAMIYEGSYLAICTSDQMSSSSVSPNWWKRWRTGVRLRPGRLYHIIATHDGIDKWVLYVNGKPVKWRRMPMSVMAMNGITATSGLRMSFGMRISSGSWVAPSYGGMVAYGRILNRLVTAAEASAMFCRNFLQDGSADLSDVGSALVEEWAFSEGTGTTVAATKSAANNGTVTGAGWVVP